ncbi:ATP-binding protein [Ruegeria arenilitoris]|uniref:ATP-binding protein n=1 Tax=Ruegeria arenilitoris TaxID=1173585 RepID=UPI001480CC94|nr:ATP-binding protein [Ruegeria arenilitoris]
MKWRPKTLAGQFLVLMVGSVMLAQVLMLATFMVETDGKIDQYERTYVLGRIAAVYKSSTHMSHEEREQLFENVSNPDIVFSLRLQPRGVPLEQSDEEVLRGLREFLDAPIQIASQPVNLWDIIRFWYQDAEENCFLLLTESLRSSDCPYWEAFVRYDDGSWLSAVGPPSPEAPVLLAPVIFSVFLTIIGITIVVALVTRRLTAPLRELSSAADLVGRGEDIDPLPETGPRELSSVMTAFNTMQERTHRFIQDRTTMLAAISHDLRTPITSLRLRAEFIENEKLQGQVIETLDDMQTMVESFLTFAKQDISEERLQEFDLVDMLNAMAAETKGMAFTSSAETCLYLGRKVSIRRALSNLVGNAIKYGHEARVRLEVDENRVCITIEDSGDGVPEDRFEEIFTPFTRLDQARSVTEGSVGLGLSIARSIVRKHGGDLIPSNLERGFRITAILPL